MNILTTNSKFKYTNVKELTIVSTLQIQELYTIQEKFNINIIEFQKELYELPYQSYTTHDLVLYNIIDIFEDFYMNYHFQNDINFFIGLLCGLKFTNINGTFRSEWIYYVSWFCLCSWV